MLLTGAWGARGDLVRKPQRDAILGSTLYPRPLLLALLTVLPPAGRLHPPMPPC